MAGTCSTKGEKIKTYLQKLKRKAAVEMHEMAERDCLEYTTVCERKCDVNLLKTKR
jgi:uncharacterized Fe-S radical SAM superfamily protein PflX